jgi:hypothetical protein
VIYLAAPYWHEDPEIRQSRVAAVGAFHAHLVRRPPRHFFYSPLANSIGATSADIPEAYWHNHGLHMLAFADSLYVYCLPGWEISVGVRKEIAEATKRHLPIHYFSPLGEEIET